MSISESYKSHQADPVIATVRLLPDLIAEVSTGAWAGVRLASVGALIQHACALLSAHVNYPPSAVECPDAMRWRVDAALFGDRLAPTVRAALRKLLSARTLPTNCNKLRQGPHNL